jgi:hypothetical protein
MLSRVELYRVGIAVEGDIEPRLARVLHQAEHLGGSAGAVVRW